jgi:hypothetical protein
MSSTPTDLQHVRSLQVDGYSRLDGGANINGALAITGSVTITGTPVTVGDNSILASPALVGLPRGTLTNGYAQVVANQAGISAEVDLTSLTVTVTTLAGRRYRITGKCRFVQNSSTGSPILSVKEDGTTIDASPLSQEATFLGALIVISIRTPTAASHIYKLTLQDTAGTVDMVAATTWPAYILVEDIGI